jgi:chromosomal replication initiator protein
VRDIVLAASDITGFTVNEIIGQSRVRDLVHTRQIVCLLAREMTGRSFPAIGAVIGDRHHTSIMAAVRTAGARRRTDIQVAALCRLIAHDAIGHAAARGATFTSRAVQ